jgi:transitional endoplasmic reticulum ATPase
LSFWLLGFDLVYSLCGNQTCLCINNYRKSGKKDFSTAILERKKSANHLVVDEAINDDNYVVAMHPATMEKLQFFRGDTMLIKPKKSKKMHIGFSGFLDKKPDRNRSV